MILKGTGLVSSGLNWLAVFLGVVNQKSKNEESSQRVGTEKFESVDGKKDDNEVNRGKTNRHAIPPLLTSSEILVLSFLLSPLIKPIFFYCSVTILAVWSPKMALKLKRRGYCSDRPAALVLSGAVDTNTH